jgi:cold shock CspA family protein
MLHFLSKINNHTDLFEHCSNVEGEGKHKLNEKMVEWERILRDGEGKMRKMV